MNQQMQTFEQRVAERIKHTVGDLIPDEQWTHLVDIGVKKFIRDDIPKMIQEECRNLAKEAISKEFAKPEWQQMWDNNTQQMIIPAITEIMINNSHNMLATMLQQAGSNVFYNLRSQLINNGSTY